jgi:hypothetical protein
VCASAAVAQCTPRDTASTTALPEEGEEDEDDEEGEEETKQQAPALGQCRQQRFLKGLKDGFLGFSDYRPRRGALRPKDSHLESRRHEIAL